jgi:hypothetical protein
MADDIVLKLDGSGPNTRIEYMYRDAGNYKRYGTAVLAGRITPDQVRTLKASLSDDMFFIPDQIGLGGLQGTFEHGAGWNEDSDHVWHTIEAVKHTTAEPTGPSVDEMLAAWPTSADGWDVAKYALELSGSPTRPSPTT